MRRPWSAPIICMMILGLLIQTNMAQAGLEDTLYEKGLLTKEEWLKNKADQERKDAIIQQTPRLKDGMRKSASAAIPRCVITSSPTINN